MAAEDNVRLTTLEDGLRVVTRHIPDYHSIDIRFRVGAGSRDEIFGTYPRGTAHADEHMVSKGSENLLPREGGRMIDRLGGYLGAATDFDSTDFFASVPNSGLVTGLFVLGDFMSSPLFLPEEWRREMPAIQNEWLDGDMDPAKMRFINTVAISSGQSALLYPVIGDEPAIASITTEHLRAFHKEKYKANNTVIAVEGHLNHNEVVDLVQKYVHMPSGPLPSVPAPLYVGGDGRFEEATRGTRVMLALPMARRDDLPATAVHKVFSELLNSSGKDSLYETMRVDRNLVYRVDALRAAFLDYTLLNIGFNSYAKNVERSVDTISGQIKQFTMHVDPEAFENLRRANHLSAQKRASEVTYGADNLVDDVYVHNRPLPRGYMDQLKQNVTIDQINEAARVMLTYRPTFYARGDLADLPSPSRVESAFRLPAAPSLNLTVEPPSDLMPQQPTRYPGQLPASQQRL